MLRRLGGRRLQQAVRLWGTGTCSAPALQPPLIDSGLPWAALCRGFADGSPGDGPPAPPEEPWPTASEADLPQPSGSETGDASDVLQRITYSRFAPGVPAGRAEDAGDTWNKKFKYALVRAAQGACSCNSFCRCDWVLGRACVPDKGAGARWMSCSAAY